MNHNNSNKRAGSAWLLAFLFVGAALVSGMIGYRVLEGMTWVDAFLNASNILSGMGPVTPLTQPSAKVFAGLFALFSGLLFISLIAIVLSNDLHAFVQQFGIDLPTLSLRRHNHRF